MTPSHHPIGLLRVVSVLSILFMLVPAMTAQAQTPPPSFKDVIRGEGAKVWMTREVTPKKKYVIAVALPNMPDPTWQSVWYGCQAQAQKLGLESRIADAGGYNKLDVQVSQIENFIQLKVDGIIIGAVQGEGV
ncbi:MAG: hypothetical protein EHM36_10720, partial [Deltaproteobacteria bacterium]